MKKSFVFGVVFLVLFLAFTVLVCKVDVSPVGQQGTDVGLSTLNVKFNNWSGSNLTAYKVSEILGYLTFLIIAVFGCLGIYQLIKRKSLFKVDGDIIALGIFYVVVLGLYVIFDKVIINYRPFCEGMEELESSYPSSHTMLVCCVAMTAVFQVGKRIANPTLKRVLTIALRTLAGVVVACRAICGVHWISDIIGAVLLSFGLVGIYVGVFEKLNGGKMVK